MDAVAWTVCGAVPLEGETANHAWSLEAVKLSVPPPEFAMLKVAGAGLVPPCVAEKLRLIGLTVRAGTGAGAFTVIVALADLDVSAALVALTVTVVSVVTVGAVNNPEALIVPAVADQVTVLFVLLLTVAVNCCVPPDAIVALVGDTVTLTGCCVVNE